MKGYVTYFDIQRDIGDAKQGTCVAGRVFLWFSPARGVVVHFVSISLHRISSALNFQSPRSDL